MAQLSASMKALVQAACDVSTARMHDALVAGADPNAVVTRDSLPAPLRAVEEVYRENAWWIRPGDSKSLFELLIGRPDSLETSDVEVFDAEDLQRVACLNMLVERGGVIDAATADKCLLYAAFSYRSPAVLRWLLDVGGADVNAREQGGRHATALHLAERTDAAGVLLAAGADVHALDAIGRTPLQARAAHNSLDAAVGLFSAHVAAGADVNARGTSGKTALHELVFFDKGIRVDFLQELLALGADPTLRCDGDTPLDWLLVLTEDDCEVWHSLDEEQRPSLNEIAAAIDELAPAAAWYRRRHMLLAIRRPAA